MANTTAVYARIDTDLKNNAEVILGKLGITPSAAIQMLYSQIVLQKGMPFRSALPDYTVSEKNGETKQDLIIERRYSSFNELINSSDSDTNRTISTVRDMIVSEVPAMLGDDCRRIILYGSYARGDFRIDSDIDIAVLTDSERSENHKYDDGIVDIAVDIGIKTSAVVNFILLPYKEFLDKKSWYPFYRNIDEEGILLYEC